MQSKMRQREVGLNAILIAPDRSIAEQFTSFSTDVNCEIMLDLKSYPSEQTLDIRIRQLQPEVVLIDTSSSQDTAVSLIAFLARTNVGLPIVALNRDRGSETILRALRAGASEFLYSPFDSGNTSEALSRLVRLRKPESPIQSATGSIVVFSSVKAGSGASMLAAQTAVYLKEQTNQRVLLADLDLVGGAIACYFKCAVDYSVVEALQHADSLNAAIWTSLVITAHGLDVLPAPISPQNGDIEAGRLQLLLDYTRTMYDWIVLDLPIIFQRTSLVTIAQADRTFLVSTSELPSLHLARKSITMLDQLGFPSERFEVIINRSSKQHGIARGDIERILRCPVHASLPNDYFSIQRGLTLGQPLSAQSELGKALHKFTAQIAAPPASSKKMAAPAADKKVRASSE